jgi:signal transduction histidine kinase
LSITDDGAGIAGDVLGKLFQPFFTTKPKGTGLGLWLSQRIVQDHGGSITVESVPGKGTTFTITLPTVTDSPQDQLTLNGRDEPPAPPLLGAVRTNQPGR